MTARLAGMKLELPFPPSLNRLFRTVLIGVCSKCRARAHATLYKSQEYQDYTTRLRVELLEQGVRPTNPTKAPVAVTVHLYRPRRVGDLDNGLKALLDTLQGYLYENDSQVLELHAFRHDDKARPRVEVEVRELGPAPPEQPELFAEPAAARASPDEPWTQRARRLAKPALISNRDPEAA